MATVSTTTPEDGPPQSTWTPQDDQPAATLGNGHPTNGGAPAPLNDATTSQEPSSDNANDYPPRGSSVDASVHDSTKEVSHRGTKQVKVLNSSPLLCSPAYPCLAWELGVCIAVVAVPHRPRPLLLPLAHL